MRAIHLTSYETAQLELVNIPIPRPSEDQVLIQVAFASINPSDLQFLSGAFAGGAAPLPLVAGKEGSGIVVQTGEGEAAVQLRNKRVAFFVNTGAWAEYVIASVSQCVVLAEELTYQQGACLLVNPPSVVMFEETLEKAGHSAVIQNAAGSALCRIVSRLLADKGVPCINIVRRDEQVQELKDQGNAYVLCSSSPDFEGNLQALAEELQATCFFDAVSGPETGRVLRQMPNGSVAYIYGSLSKQRCYGVPTSDIIWKRKQVRGLFFSRWQTFKTDEEKRRMFERIMREIHIFGSNIASEVQFDGFIQALEGYRGNMSAGKVLLSALSN